MRLILFGISLLVISELYCQTDSSIVFRIAEWPPVFQEDETLVSWYEYIEKGVNNSGLCVPDSTSRRVIVGFIIDSTGHVLDPWIIEGINSASDLEAISIISRSPKWRPATHNGINVDVQMVSPVDFNIKPIDKSSL